MIRMVVMGSSAAVGAGGTEFASRGVFVIIKCNDDQKGCHNIYKVLYK